MASARRLTSCGVQSPELEAGLQTPRGAAEGTDQIPIGALLTVGTGLRVENGPVRDGF